MNCKSGGHRGRQVTEGGATFGKLERGATHGGAVAHRSRLTVAVWEPQAGIARLSRFSKEAENLDFDVQFLNVGK